MVQDLRVTGGKRTAALPDVPTIAEAGVPGYEATNWYGIVAPARTAQPVVRRLNAEINKAVKVPVVARTVAQSLPAAVLDPFPLGTARK